MARPAPLLACALLGAAGGLRTTMPPAALAITGRSRLPQRARWAPVAAAAGELVIDKLPQTPSRLDPRGLILRAASSAAAAAELGGRAGVACAVPAAIVAAHAGYHARRALGSATGLPDPLLGALEDAVAITVAALALRALD